MKKLLISGLLIAGVVLYSCGGDNNSSENNDNGVVSNAVIPPQMTDGSAPPSTVFTTKSTESNSSGIDIDAYSDSKGVGEFKNVEIPSSVDPALASKGKELFQTSCTACHTATDQKLIGPGLKGITKIRTPEWIMNMITGPIQMVKEDSVAHAVFEEFNRVQMTNQGISKEGARAIYEFFRQNDGA